MKPDYVVCVGGTPGHGWLTLPSDEDDDPDAVVITEDPELVARFSGYEEARPWFERLVAAHPARRFRMMTINPLQSNELLSTNSQ